MTSPQPSDGKEVRIPSAWLDELAEFLNNAAGAHGFQGMGIQLARERITTLPRDPGNPDPLIYMGIGDPKSPEAQQYQVWRVADLPKHLADDGPVMAQIGHEWLVHVFTAWEHHFRPGLAAALGVTSDSLRLPLLGDLRLLRNDVVHHRGVATRANTGHCEVLGHWFKPGDMIRIRGQEVAEFMRVFPWAELQRRAETQPQ